MSGRLVLPWADQPYVATWEELTTAFGTTTHRRALLYTALARLERMDDDGLPLAAIWINGSFVTAKERPSDIDALVLIDGEGLATFRDRLLPHGDSNAYINGLEQYEDGGTAHDHQTDFHYVVYYPPTSGWWATTQGDLELWFDRWCRLDDPSLEGVSESTLVSDAKGFVEVRWSDG
ncbi:DUF6932 family protein [Saccharothrix algeriensis]|uniref:Polymerase nucleotidyl transferase domain-containing protein n=1 Tax=Saccharothrix algeriensis TaxID=173560 RepID=A0ABS2S6Y5_9PSEU|nr:hypothetical protein [Saccharothrix algeriensis]MBM7812001.1 hypothetical protein [Saccharothrix algeriensis]